MIRGPRPKGLRARLRVFYWNNDRFRRLVSWTRANWFVVLAAMLGLALHLQSLRGAREQVEGYAAGYREAMDRASSLNDQLRTALEEQKTLRRERDACEEKRKSAAGDVPN